MIDNDQITSLAREYAEEMIKGKPSEELPNCLKNSMLTMNTEYVAEIFRWLLRRYALVEKEAVRKAYKAAQYSFNNASDPVMPTMEFHNGEMSALESLFPDLGKEVEG